MMTVEIVKRMKMKKNDLDKADVVKREVCSRDEVMHVGKNGLCFCCVVSCSDKDIEIRNSGTIIIGLLELEFQLIVYF